MARTQWESAVRADRDRAGSLDDDADHGHSVRPKAIDPTASEREDAMVLAAKGQFAAAEASARARSNPGPTTLIS